MKKLLLTVILLLLFVPVLVNAETCDNDKVYIDSISIDKNNNVTELQEATANGKNIDLTLNMSNVGDNIRYKIVIKNDSNEDYVVDKNSVNISSKYIDYIIESDNSNIVKAKSSKTIYLRVNYSHPVPKEAFKNGVLNDDINMKVNLSSNNLSNPNTGIKYILFISLIVLLMIGTLIIIRKKKLSKLMILIISLSMFIPISVYALCKCDINITSNVYISDEPFTGTIYRDNSYSLNVGDSIKSMYLWVAIEKNTNQPIFDYDSKEECINDLNNEISQGHIQKDEYYCKLIAYSKGGDYKTNPNDLDRKFYIKDEINNDIVTKNQVCFVTDKEVCLLPDASNFEANYNALLQEETWIQNHEGHCNFDSTSLKECTSADFKSIVLRATGETHIKAYDGFICTPISCGYPTRNG